MPSVDIGDTLNEIALTYLSKYAERDDLTEDKGEFPAAARCYIGAADYATGKGEPVKTWMRDQMAPWLWPEAEWDPTGDPIEMLTEAAACIVAEIERLEEAKRENDDE